MGSILFQILSSEMVTNDSDVFNFLETNKDEEEEMQRGSSESTESSVVVEFWLKESELSNRKIL